MGLAPRVSLSAVIALVLTSVSPAMAEAAMTPQEACAALHEALRADCVAAGELLLDPAGMPGGDVDMTVSLRAESGAVSAEYQRFGTDKEAIACRANRTVVLPAGEDLRLHLTAIDAIYTFVLPGHMEPLDLVPGRVEERRLTTPAEAGDAMGTLRADADGKVAEIAVRFVADAEGLDGNVLCVDPS